MANHRIETIRVHTVNIPAKAVHSHGSGDVTGINAVILEVLTDTGLTGWGEASPWPVFTGTAEGNAAALHAHLRPHLIGRDPVQVEKHLNMADKVIVGHNEAKAALETALLDITGQISGLPITELVGGRQRDEIPLSFSVANPDFDSDLDDIAALYEDGVRLFKLKTGFADHAFDVMRLEKLRERFGDAVSLRIDYNQGLPAYDALRRIRDLKVFMPAFVEQPVKMHERAALSEITRAVDTPIMADESVFDPARGIAGCSHAYRRYLRPQDHEVGRHSSGARGHRDRARRGDRGLWRLHVRDRHCPCCRRASDGGSTRPASGCEFYMSTYYSKEDILTAPFPVKNGKVHVPTTPGLGVGVDADKLPKYWTGLLA